jgi:hypothetical protein
MCPGKYGLGFYIPEHDILRSHRRENLNSNIALTGCALKRRCNVSPGKYELGFYILEEDILHNHRRESLKSYKEKSNDLTGTRTLNPQASTTCIRSGVTVHCSWVSVIGFGVQEMRPSRAENKMNVTKHYNAHSKTGCDFKKSFIQFSP